MNPEPPEKPDPDDILDEEREGELRREHEAMSKMEREKIPPEIDREWDEVERRYYEDAKVGER